MPKAKKLKENKCMPNCCDSGGAIYGLGFIGSAFYYISNASSFWMGFLGVLKSLLWPAFLIYDFLKFLGA